MNEYRALSLRDGFPPPPKMVLDHGWIYASEFIDYKMKQKNLAPRRLAASIWRRLAQGFNLFSEGWKTNLSELEDQVVLGVFQQEKLKNFIQVLQLIKHLNHSIRDWEYWELDFSCSHAGQMPTQWHGIIWSGRRQHFKLHQDKTKGGRGGGGSPLLPSKSIRPLTVAEQRHGILKKKNLTNFGITWV
jgi:hypothetical protein